MKNKALKTLFIYNGIFVLAGAMLGPLYAIYVEEFVDGVMAVSISWAAFLISTTVFTYIISRKGDKTKEKEYLLLAGYFIRIIAWLSFIFVGNLWALILVQILLGLGEAFGTPSFNTLVASHLDKNKYIKEYSLLMLSTNLFSAVGVLIGGVVVKFMGFQTLFMLMAVLSLIPFFIILLKPRKLL